MPTEQNNQSVETAELTETSVLDKLNLLDEEGNKIEITFEKDSNGNQ